jgi:CHASE2 domain-containing sensor protein
MKKIAKFLTPLLILVAIIGITFYYFTNKYNTYVRLAGEQNEEIVLINVGKADRTEIADLLLAIHAKKPAVIGLDVTFSELKEKVSDSLLAFAIKETKPVLCYQPKALTNAYFLKQASYGLAVIEGKHASYVTNWRITAGTLNHFAYEVAHAYNQEKAISYKNSLDSKKLPIVIQYLQKDFEVLQYEEVADSTVSLKDKIVLIGYLGPSNEDKHMTYARYEMKDPPAQDTYGVVLLANLVMMIINQVQP